MIQPKELLTDEMRNEITERLALKFTPEVLEEIRRIKILHAQAEAELMKIVFT